MGAQFSPINMSKMAIKIVKNEYSQYGIREISAQERHGLAGAEPPLLQRQAEKTGVIQPGKENAPVRPHCNVQVFKGGTIRKMRADVLEGPVAIRQGVIVLNLRSVDLGQK